MLNFGPPVASARWLKLPAEGVLWLSARRLPQGSRGFQRDGFRPQDTGFQTAEANSGVLVHGGAAIPGLQTRLFPRLLSVTWKKQLDGRTRSSLPLVRITSFVE